MSEQQQDTTETTEAAQEATGASLEAQPDQDAPQEAQNPNAEAKKYRLRLRETEAELETAQQRVAHLQRTLAEAALEDHLSSPGDLWDVGGQDVSTFYSEDGDLDRDRLTEAARQLTQDRPGLSAQRGAYVAKIADPARGRPKDTFIDAFKPVRQR